MRTSGPTWLHHFPEARTLPLGKTTLGFLGRWYRLNEALESDLQSKGMKRTGYLYQKIISLENLYLADLKARKGKADQNGVKLHMKQQEANLQALHYALLDKTFRTSKYTTFTIRDPKERLISCLPYFPDRIVHHAVMNVLEPIFVAHFTADTYSCIKCRVCGCTQEDCSQCIEASGQPCHWVDEDLCSRCEGEMQAARQALDSATTKEGVTAVCRQYHSAVEGDPALWEAYLKKLSDAPHAERPEPAIDTDPPPAETEMTDSETEARDGGTEGRDPEPADKLHASAHTVAESDPAPAAPEKKVPVQTSFL